MEIAYKAARIIDGREHSPLLNSVLILDGSRVEGVIPEAELGNDLKVVDLGDCTLLPGLIDCHVHLSCDGTPLHSVLYEKEAPELTLLRAARRAFTSLSSGITALRDMASPAGIMPALRDAINLGVMVGPRIVVCDTMLTITGGYGRKRDITTREVDGVEEMRKAVRELFKAGADFIKIMANGKIKSEVGPIEVQEHFSLEELKTAVDEAHRLGRKVAVHVNRTKGIESCIKAGVDTIEHANYLTEELGKQMVDKGIYLVPTLHPYFVSSHPPKELLAVITQQNKMKAEYLWKGTMQAFQLARELGIKIGAGSDSGGPCYPHSSLKNELEMMVSHGFSPMEAIISATRTNAEILGLPEIGTLEKGKIADVIAVDGDPLRDIKTLSKVVLVLKDGKEVSNKSQTFC